MDRETGGRLIFRGAAKRSRTLPRRSVIGCRSQRKTRKAIGSRLMRSSPRSRPKRSDTRHSGLARPPQGFLTLERQPESNL